MGRMTLLGTGAAVAPAFTPLSIGNLQLWFKADAGITLNGSTVSQWNDQSGNSRHMIQATAANQPTLTTGAINGLAAITFDGTNDYMALSADYEIVDKGTYFVVCKVSSQKENSFMTGASGNYSFLQYNADWYVGVISQAANSMTNNTWYLRGAVADGGAANVATRYSNGTAKATTTCGTGYRRQRYIGQYNFEAVRYLNGAIAEILVFNKALNSTEIASVNDYLNNKYVIY